MYGFGIERCSSGRDDGRLDARVKREAAVAGEDEVVDAANASQYQSKFTGMCISASKSESFYIYY